jgi:hypothetical protein
MEIIDAPDVMTMEDDPREILRAKKNFLYGGRACGSS